MNTLFILMIAGVQCSFVVAPTDVTKASITVHNFVYYDDLTVSETELPAGAFIHPVKDIYNGIPYSCSNIISKDSTLTPFDGTWK